MSFRDQARRVRHQHEESKAFAQSGACRLAMREKETFAVSWPAATVDFDLTIQDTGNDPRRSDILRTVILSNRER